MSADRISPLFGSSFGALLRRYREAAGVTQEELAARAGLSVRGISDLERGLRQTPRRATVEMLADALNLPPRKRALLASAARPAAETASQVEGHPAMLRNLPAQPTPLLGREREVAMAVDLLGRGGVRLLTLTGPGGVGKTRLAWQVAEDLAEHFEDGVCAVMLAGVRDPTLVMPAVAGALGLRQTPDEPLTEQVGAFLRDRQILLLLDNFEHLLAAAPQLATLLAACPHQKALITSRESLRIGGEHEIAVAPLDEDAAVELFLRCARAIQPALGAVDSDLAVTREICQAVDRLPLAVELAAVWVKVLTLPALLARLSSPLDLLASGHRDAEPRQRTLRDTIAWSERLLEPHEQYLFRRLAVFSGGFTLEAAEAICGDAEATGSVLDGLAGLVEKSLLQVELPQSGARYGMLETIRDYAQERLRASGEMETLARRHAEYFAGLVMELGWVGPEQDARDQRMEQELPNARAALEWTLEHDAPALGLRLATPLGRRWYSRGSLDEGERWLHALLTLDAEAGERAAPPELRIAAIYALILIVLDLHEFDRAEALANEGLDLARRSGDAAGAGNMLTELGHVAEARGDLDAAKAYFEDGLAHYGAAEDQGRSRGAVGRALSSLGNIARAKGDYDLARRYLEQMLAWARERNFSWAVASGLVSLGHVACEEGVFSRAAALYRESLGLYRAMRNPVAVALCLEGVAAVAAARGDSQRAARLSGAVAGLRDTLRVAATAEWMPFVRAREDARQALGDEAFDSAFAAGHSFTLERVIADALAATDTFRG